VRDPDAVGTDHVAYSYNNLGELLSTYRRLKAAGIAPHRPINHGVTTSMYYRDLDNNRVELQIDNFATPAELDGYFHSRALQTLTMADFAVWRKEAHTRPLGISPKLPKRTGRLTGAAYQPSGEVLLLICCRCSNEEIMNTISSCIRTKPRRRGACL